jgi:YegS/Rv2252/BmrU family lipid kinase
LKICCILNDKSGTAVLAGHAELRAEFSKHGIIPDIFKVENGRSFGDLAKQALKKDYDIIVAGGGDGTINAVAAALVGQSSTRLGVLPLGTLNHFARDLGIPFDIRKAVDIICTGQSKAVDVGMVNDCYFLNNSSLGLYPAIVKLRESLQSAGYGKWWAALISCLRILSKFRRFELEVQPSTGQYIRRKTALLFIGNNAYETVAHKLGTRLAMDRGKLWINMPTATTRIGLFRGLVGLMFGREKPTDTLIFEATALRVNSKKKLLTVATDGEILRLKPPLNYRILPNALHVTVPAPQSKAQ